VELHPGIDRSAFAAGREALSELYRCYAAFEDAERACQPRKCNEELTAAVAVADRCLAELRNLRAALVAASERRQLADVQRTIERVEVGVGRLVQRSVRGRADR
jgi:hypothetical protein